MVCRHNYSWWMAINNELIRKIKAILIATRKKAVGRRLARGFGSSAMSVRIVRKHFRITKASAKTPRDRREVYSIVVESRTHMGPRSIIRKKMSAGTVLRTETTKIYPFFMMTMTRIVSVHLRMIVTIHTLKNRYHKKPLKPNFLSLDIETIERRSWEISNQL